MEINKIRRPESLRAGERIKVVNGPFHVKVYRSTFTMDVYLQGTYVRSYPVGLGAPGRQTPFGLWHIKAGGKFSECHFIEFMACPGGCLGGGGQPIPTSPKIRKARAKAIYAEDRAYEVRKSHENPAVLKVYEEFLTDGPGGRMSHRLLHTHYTPRGKYIT